MVKRLGYELMVVLVIFSVFYGFEAIKGDGVVETAVVINGSPEAATTATPQVEATRATPQVEVTRATPQVAATTSLAGPSPTQATSASQTTSELVLAGIDLNSADAATIAQLKGIGPVLAQRIVDHRQSAGPFKDLEGLIEVKGIGPKLLKKIKLGQRDGQ